MNYSQAKALAKKRVYETRIDHVISFDGVSYSIAMLPKYKGNITEVIKYKYVKPTKVETPIENENPEPVKVSPKKKTRKVTK